MISILILTHNRPSLFHRCISSVIAQLPADAEIIVNNDSNDILEIEHSQVRYYYNKFDNLSDIYKFLFDQSNREYVYFLEDDDYLRARFFEQPLDADLIVGNYIPTYSTTDILSLLAQHKNTILSPDEFIKQINIEHLQLSQHIFKRSTIQDFDFGKDNNVHNDLRLVLHSATHSKTIRTTSTVFFYQTIDGGDNISFPESNHSVNTTQSLKFLEDYGLQTPASHRPRP